MSNSIKEINKIIKNKELDIRVEAIKRCKNYHVKNSKEQIKELKSLTKEAVDNDAICDFIYTIIEEISLIVADIVIDNASKSLKINSNKDREKYIDSLFELESFAELTENMEYLDLIPMNILHKAGVKDVKNLERFRVYDDNDKEFIKMNNLTELVMNKAFNINAQITMGKDVYVFLNDNMVAVIVRELLTSFEKNFEADYKANQKNTEIKIKEYYKKIITSYIKGLDIKSFNYINLNNKEVVTSVVNNSIELMMKSIEKLYDIK